MYLNLTPDSRLPTPKRKASGFTLIELLVVMAILGILTTIVASSFSSSQEKAHDARRKSDLEGLAKALEVYYNDNNRYPQSNSGNLNVTDCGATGANPCSWGGEFTDTAGTVYMAKVPEETSSARRFYYTTDAQFQSYARYTRLENDLDKDIPRDAAEANQYYSGSNCGPTFTGASSGCNYAISSTNTKPESFFPLVVE